MAYLRQRPAPNAIFYGEQGATINIHDGNFTQHNHVQPEPAFAEFNPLHRHVAMAAFDSAQQVDTPKCHPNTRLAVIDEIMNWIFLTVMRTKWILWLNGAAGAGKSAIARSIVDLCLTKNIPVSRFFFFRTDSMRNTIQPVAATLVYQLIQQLPGLSEIVNSKIKRDPLIFTKSLKTQLGHLVFEPLRQLHCESPLSIVVLLLDGLDECIDHASQTTLVRVIGNFLCSQDLPIIAFFGSRAESQLQQVFRSYEVSTVLLQLALDNNYLPDGDISLFLREKFKEIRETHPFSRNLGKDWPDPEHVQVIIKKSSGQFIYASLVINFISSPRHHPAQQLEIIRGLRPAGKLTPFAQLDALYRHIFSHVEEFDRTALILAWRIFRVGKFNPGLESFFGISGDDICVLLADLTSVIVYKDREIHFLHASLPDFLLDQSRSQDYYIDKKFWCTRLSIRYFRIISEGMSDALYPLLEDYLPYAEGTAELRERALELDYNRLFIAYMSWDIINYLTAIQRLDFGDDGEFYRGQLNWASRYILEHPDRYKLNGAELALWRIDKTGPTARANIERGDTTARRLLANSDTCGQQSEAEIARHAALRDWERIWTVTPDFRNDEEFYDNPFKKRLILYILEHSNDENPT